MPQNRQKIDQKQQLFSYFSSGEPQLSINRRRLRQIWRDHREEFLDEWITRHPGTRPFIWWTFEAPGTRLKVSGRYHIDMPLRWAFGTPVNAVDDLHDPPIFESEADFLDRHGLLTDDERRAMAEMEAL